MRPEVTEPTSTPYLQISVDDPALISVPSPVVRLPPKQLAIEIASRIGAAAALSVFLAASIIQFAKNPSRITLLLFVFTALLDVGLVVFTRVVRERDWAPLSMGFAMVGTFYYAAFRTAPGIHVIPEAAAAGLQITGVVIQLCAKLTLRRSFGLLPANRGVVMSGPYRILRHPIYFGYFVRDLGFLLANFGIQNVIVVAVHYCVQICRIVREERVLSKDSRYLEYMGRVRYRLVIGVF